MNNLKPYPKYKPSNIAWLGDIPEHWEVRKLKYSLNINNGSDYKHIQSDSGYPVIGSGGQFAYAKEFMFDGEVVFLGRKGTIDKPLYFKGKFWAVDTMFYANGKNGNNVKFHYYVSTQIPFRLYSTSTALPSMTQTDLKEHYLAYPSIPEQQAIANFLDYKLAKIDRFIQKKKQLIKLLNEQKAGIINDAVTKGLNPNAKMKPSDIEWLGDIPEHWDSVKTKNVFKLVTEIAPPNNTEVLLSIYTQYGVKPRTEFEERGNRATTTDNYWIVKKQDIIVNKLLAWMGAIGISEYDGVTSPAYDILRSKGKADPYFYHYLFRSPIAFTEFKRHSRGIMDVRLRLYFSEFGNIKLPVPPLEEQKSIVQHIEQETAQINTVIQTIEKEIALTQEYRVALIAEAVTGKIDVRAYEIPETPVMELYEELEDEMSLAAEEEVGYGIE